MLLAITVLTPYFYFIPKSCLAAVIITAVIFMVEVHLVKLVWRSRSRCRWQISNSKVIFSITLLNFRVGFDSAVRHIHILPIPQP